LTQFFSRIFRLFSSLKFAVLVMSGLTAAMIAATVLESIYDTPTGQYFVYRAFWFYALLFLLGVNIFVVAVSRWPWKKHHTAFLLAHAGILLLLIGSWITYQWGLDAMMRVKEGESSSRVEVNEPQLILSEGSQVEMMPIKWLPPQVKFKPFTLKNYPIEMVDYISRADADYTFVPAPTSSEEASLPAFAGVLVRIEGGMMRIRQEYWVWGGDRSYSRVQAGPALVVLKNEGTPGSLRDLLAAQGGVNGPALALSVDSVSAQVSYLSRNSEGVFREGKAQAGQEIEPGWRGGVKVAFDKVIPRAIPEVSYRPAKVQYGPQAPPSAIQIQAAGSRMWLGSGDRATLQLGERRISIAYTPKTYLLPYALQLERFEIQYYEGTRQPASYSSQVRIVKEKDSTSDPITISMNEPLENEGLTFYQSSYEDAQPRPTVSIFTVNRDPGRGLKYLGSILLVAGSVLLFYRKLKQSRKRVSVP